MARTAQHPSEERIAIAMLSGAARKWAGHILRGNLAYPRDAIAELHSISTDGHLLAHACVETNHWQHSTIEALLLLAGANPKVMAGLVADLDRRSR